MAHVDGQQDIGGMYQRPMGQGRGAKEAERLQRRQLGILDLLYVESYKTFLNERKALKDRVDSDFAEWEAAREDESIVVV